MVKCERSVEKNDSANVFLSGRDFLKGSTNFYFLSSLVNFLRHA